ncbi:MAG: hypothetical protein VYC34_07750, partial [Planctomycetota bacterium]|nr:hypothetical protein [Planctomycetota bacterium]
MYRTTSRIAMCAAVILGSGAAALAGPDWIEGGDAGSSPGTAQAPAVAGLRSIAGSLTGFDVPLRGDGDFEDVYLIEIKDVDSFIAETDGSLDGGSAEFQSLLFLFDLQGNAIIGNVQSPGIDRGGTGTFGSRLEPGANDGTGAMVPGPGLYYLAICGGGNFPRDQNQVPLFDFDSFGEISGPDGGGGKNDGVISGWEGPGETGNYLIFLEGVSGLGMAPVA